MVKLIEVREKRFEKYLSNREILCIGAGKRFYEFLDRWEGINSTKIIGVVDNYKSKEEKKIDTSKGKIPLLSIHESSTMVSSNTVLLVTNVQSYMELVEQLDLFEEFNGLECIVEFITAEKSEYRLENYYYDKQVSIPRVIHYCWFGKSEIPDHLKSNIESWRKFCPDYEIRRWDESNYDYTKNKYMSDAYDAKKWGFVPDYARLDIVYNHGGFYLDTDVELVKSLDCVANSKMVCGFEGVNNIGMGIGFGAIPSHPMIRELRDEYDSRSFSTSGGELIASNSYITNYFKSKGIRLDNTYQETNDFVIYPSEVFSPISTYGKVTGVGITEKTVSIHHYEASWIENNKERYHKRNENCMKYENRVKVIKWNTI